MPAPEPPDAAPPSRPAKLPPQAEAAGVSGAAASAGRIDSLPAASFDAVVFSLVFSYLPLAEQRAAMVAQARKLLDGVGTPFPGLLLLVDTFSALGSRSGGSCPPQGGTSGSRGGVGIGARSCGSKMPSSRKREACGRYESRPRSCALAYERTCCGSEPLTHMKMMSTGPSSGELAKRRVG